MALFFTKREPVYVTDDEFHIYGLRADLHGVVVLLQKSTRNGKWYVYAVQTRGLLRHSQVLSLQSTYNSCEYDMIEGARGGIRVRFDRGIVVIEVKDSDDVSYRKCTTQNLQDG